MSGPTTGSLDPRGPVAEAIADLWWLMLALGIGAFAVFAVALAVGLLRPPAEPPAGRPDRTYAGWLVGGGVVLPLVLIVVVFAATLVVMRDLPDDPPPDALTVEVTGLQWRYRVDYPELGVADVDELHLPVGRPVALRLTSEDVIHSFWVPELGGKLDLLPDGTNTLVIEADRPGEYGARCAEFCGLEHASMTLRVVAEPPEEFEAWIEARR